VKKKTHPFGSSQKAFLFSSLLLLLMWLFYWAQHLFDFNFYELGVLPRTAQGLIGVVFMPLIHSQREIEHIINNSIPTFLLLSTLIFYYQDIAFRVFAFGWIYTGLGLWVYAENNGVYHIGMSGVVYMLAGFLFTSGSLRRFLPLQAISLFIVFLYGSMIWGIFPMDEKISWEGHFIGLCVGVLLAFYYREKGPQRPKFQYEIEKEMGIEPPDLEGIYNERLQEIAREEELKKQQEDQSRKIIYHYKPNSPQDDNDVQ
jgi:membrane associated rhomboid family serine protease